MDREATTEAPDRDLQHRPIDVCVGLNLSVPARMLLDGDPAPAAYLTALLQQQCHADGVKYLAHALPKPDAVMWACVCVRMALGATVAAGPSHALAAAEAWANDPKPATCLVATAAAADSIANDRGARFAALAASWGGESLAPDGLPLVPPPPGLTAEGVAAAVMIAATSGDPAQIDQSYRSFIARGIMIARARNGVPGL